MRYVIVGGGIAGVNCCLEILRNDRSPNSEVLLISASNYVKTVTNWYKIGQFTEHFNVAETEEPLTNDNRLEILHATVISWDSEAKIVSTNKGNKIHYDKLCISTGAKPKNVEFDNMDNILYIRDTETAIDLQEKLGKSRSVVIVGNGGIATELVYELHNIKITWIIRDSFASSSFFPPQVQSFILPKLLEGRKTGSKNFPIVKRSKYKTSDTNPEKYGSCQGAALGPDWCTSIDFTGSDKDSSSHYIDIIYNSEVTNIKKTDGGVTVEYKNTASNESSEIRCDFVISAIGVSPNSQPWIQDKHLKINKNEQIIVDELLQTSIQNVFSCGDVCEVERGSDSSNLWRQMCLWTQARQLGELCGKSMTCGEEARMFNIYFEIFTHCTTFFGLKVVFIGDYKPEQHEIDSCNVIERIIGDSEYVRCILVDYKMIGALLIGETNLEETMENMILNGTNLEGIEQSFLDPFIEIDDYFD